MNMIIEIFEQPAQPQEPVHDARLRNLHIAMITGLTILLSGALILGDPLGLAWAP